MFTHKVEKDTNGTSLGTSFWKQWMKNYYLPILTKRSEWINDQNPAKVINVDILVDDPSPRYTWMLGRIIRLFSRPDGRIRVIDVKTYNGQYRRNWTINVK